MSNHYKFSESDLWQKTILLIAGKIAKAESNLLKLYNKLISKNSVLIVEGC